MKGIHLVYFLLCLPFSSCQVSESRQFNIKETNTLKNPDTTVQGSFQAKRAADTSSSQKISSEKDRLFQETVFLIKQFSSYEKPRFTSYPIVDSAARNRLFSELVETGDRYINISKFSKEVRDSFVFASEKTGKYDGKCFLLRNFDNCERCNAAIVYCRNEGGHSDDVISLMIVREDEKIVYYLPLFYFFGREGYEVTIESVIDRSIVRRRITERYGSQVVTKELLDKQPRSETVQKFRIERNGMIALLDEKTVNYNFEEYIGH